MERAQGLSLKRSVERLQKTAEQQRKARQSNGKKASAKRSKAEASPRFVYEADRGPGGAGRTTAATRFRHFQFVRERGEVVAGGAQTASAVLAMPLAAPVRAPFSAARCQKR